MGNIKSLNVEYKKEAMVKVEEIEKAINIWQQNKLHYESSFVSENAKIEKEFNDLFDFLKKKQN